MRHGLAVADPADRPNPLERRLFSLPEVSERCGVEYRTLHTWLRRGLIQASAREAAGSGTRNELTFSDLVVTKALSDLRRLGLGFDALSSVADRLRGADALSDTTMLINGAVQAVERRCEAAELSRTTGPVLVVRMREVRESLEVA